METMLVIPRIFIPQRAQHAQTMRVIALHLGAPQVELEFGPDLQQD